MHRSLLANRFRMIQLLAFGRIICQTKRMRVRMMLMDSHVSRLSTERNIHPLSDWLIPLMSVGLSMSSHRVLNMSSTNAYPRDGAIPFSTNSRLCNQANPWRTESALLRNKVQSHSRGKCASQESQTPVSGRILMLATQYQCLNLETIPVRPAS